MESTHQQDDCRQDCWGAYVCVCVCVCWTHMTMKVSRELRSKSGCPDSLMSSRVSDMPSSPCRIMLTWNTRLDLFLGKPTAQRRQRQRHALQRKKHKRIGMASNGFCFCTCDPRSSQQGCQNQYSTAVFSQKESHNKFLRNIIISLFRSLDSR